MLIVGIVGGTSSGKTAIAREVADRLADHRVVLLPQDSYYKDASDLPEEERLKQNFDHPDSVDFDLLVRHLKDLKAGKKIEQPMYSYVTCLRSEDTLVLEPGECVIVEGILVFSHPELLELLDVKVFVDVDADDRLLRLIKRDVVKRGRTIEQVMDRYEHLQKPMHQQFVEPGRKLADIIIPRGKRNKIGIDVLVGYLSDCLGK